MANPITVNVDLPSDNNDVLSGTPLESVPGPGILQVYLASSQRDGILTVGGPAVMGGGAYRVPPVLRANGIPAVESDVPYVVAVGAGKVMITYDEVTAGDAFMTAIYEAA